MEVSGPRPSVVARSDCRGLVMSSATTRNAQLASEKPRRSSGDGGKGRGTRTWGRMEEWTWGRARWVDGPSVCKYVRGAHCIAISAPSALRLFEGSTVHRRHGPSDGGTHQLSCSRPPSGRGPLVCGWRSAGLHVGLVGHGTVLHGPTEHDMSSIASNCTLGPSGGGNPAGEGRRDLGIQAFLCLLGVGGEGWRCGLSVRGLLGGGLRWRCRDASPGIEGLSGPRLVQWDGDI